MAYWGWRRWSGMSEHILLPMASDCIHLAFALRPEMLCVLPAPCCLAIKFTLKLSRNQGAWVENRFCDKVGMPLAWWHSGNQSEIFPLGILMKGDSCVCGDMFLLICCDTFCRWLPGSLWWRCVLLSCMRTSSRLFISDSINACFSADYVGVKMTGHTNNLNIG